MRENAMKESWIRTRCVTQESTKVHRTILKEGMRESAVKPNWLELRGAQCAFPPGPMCRKAQHHATETIKTVIPCFSSEVHLKKNSSETQTIHLRFATETRENEGQPSRRNRQSIWTDQRTPHRSRRIRKPAAQPNVCELDPKGSQTLGCADEDCRENYIS